MRVEHNHWAGLVEPTLPVSESARPVKIRKRDRERAARRRLEQDKFRVQLSLSLTQSQSDWLEAYAGGKKSAFIRRLLEHEINRISRKDS